MNLLKYEARAEWVEAKKRAEENAKALAGREAYYNEQGRHYLDKEFETAYIKDVPDSQYSVPNYDKELNYLNNKIRDTDMYLGKISKMRSDGSIEILTSTKDYNTTKQKIDWLKRKADSINNNPAYSDTNNNNRYTALKNLQGLFDSGDLENIDQRDYGDVPLFVESTLKETGCGMFAAMIAQKMFGDDVDVFEAYEYFNNPNNKIIYNAINPNALNNYLSSKGIDCNLSSLPLPKLKPDSKYINTYVWTDLRDLSKTTIGAHYHSFFTDSNCNVIGYNDFRADKKNGITQPISLNEFNKLNRQLVAFWNFELIK